MSQPISKRTKAALMRAIRTALPAKGARGTPLDRNGLEHGRQLLRRGGYDQGACAILACVTEDLGDPRLAYLHNLAEAARDER